MVTLKSLINKLFKHTETLYNELIYSEEYISSTWRIRHIKTNYLEGYALYNRSNDRYLDLVSHNLHQWKYNDNYFKDCVTKSKKFIIYKFHQVKKINGKFKFSDEQILNEIDIKVIERYLRNKKLNKLL